MNRRTFLRHTRSGATVLATVGLHQDLSAQAETEAIGHPNIILIMADDLGYGHLGCYGQRIIHTPHIDRLAREGMRFTQAYAGCTVCAPSRSVLTTGYHSGHTPVRGNTGGISLRDRDITLAEILQHAGYKTGLFGKWGLGDANTEGVPNKQGFDEFFGYLHQKHAQFYYTDYLWHNSERFLLSGNRNGQQQQYSHDVILERALSFIESEKENPFFCFLSFTLPHHEFTVPEETLSLYAGQFEETGYEVRWREGYAMPAEPKATMAAMITHADKGVGQVIERLERLNIRDKTLVIFASDNGAGDYELACPQFFQANGPLRGYKGSLYEGGIRVPAIASWPGAIASGSESHHVWYFADILPTFAELAGAAASVPYDCDGLSFVPELLGEKATGTAQAKHPFLYWETGSANLDRAGRMGDWKAVWPSGGAPLELYDLQLDIGETNNIAPNRPDIVEEMKGYLERNHTAPPPQIEPEKPDSRDYW